jgi:protein phosphatase 2C family protein 2/3
LTFTSGSLIAYPDVEVREVNPDWEFLVIACDGIWDVMTNEVSF